jgi:hypothetical protein
MENVMFNFLKAKPKTTADEKLEEIERILFPPFKKETNKDVTFLVDYSVDSNLQSAVNDLEEGHNDEIVRGTINKVVDRIVKVRAILDAYNEIDLDAKYIIVDDYPTNDKDVEVGPEGRY